MENHFIYLYTFPNGKYYVGQTYHGSHRYGKPSSYKRQVVYNAMAKYPDFKKEILVDNLTDIEVDDFERYYIKQYESLINQNGYNMDTGGNLNKNHSEETKMKMSKKIKQALLSEEIRKKMSEARKGKHLSKETRDKISEKNYYKNKFGKDNPSSKSILQYSKDGKLIKEWNSMMDVERELNIDNGHISAVCLGKRKSAGGYIWKYKN